MNLFYSSFKKTSGWGSPYNVIIRGSLSVFDFSRFAERFLRHCFEIWGAQIPAHFKIIPVRHHLAHAASAFYFSGYESGSVITVDGMGESESTVIWRFRGSEIEEIVSLDASFASLGALYDAITERLGFDPIDGAGKVMGLAPYGKNSSSYIFLKEFLKMREDEDLPYFLQFRSPPEDKHEHPFAGFD
jgi:carbamoyltransferase